MKKLNLLTDEQLAVRYINGDDKAFDELLKRVQDKLYNYIFFLVKDEAAADDFFQETLTKAINYMQLGHYTIKGRFQGWLCRIAHNMIMDSYRHNRSCGFVDSRGDIDITAFRGSSSIRNSHTCCEAEMAYNQSLTDARKLMDALPETQREVVFMRFYQNLSFKEIAETTNVSINTALGRMRYAVLNMRKLARQHNIELAV